LDVRSYEKQARKKEEEFESVCTRCGECCGSLDDSCQKLMRLDNGTYFCSDYTNRLVQQKTISGKFFTCIAIREHIAQDTLRQNCAYRKI